MKIINIKKVMILVFVFVLLCSPTFAQENTAESKNVDDPNQIKKSISIKKETVHVSIEGPHNVNTKEKEDGSVEVNGATIEGKKGNVAKVSYTKDKEGGSFTLENAIVNSHKITSGKVLIENGNIFGKVTSFGGITFKGEANILYDKKTKTLAIIEGEIQELGENPGFKVGGRFSFDVKNFEKLKDGSFTITKGFVFSIGVKKGKSIAYTEVEPQKDVVFRIGDLDRSPFGAKEGNYFLMDKNGNIDANGNGFDFRVIPPSSKESDVKPGLEYVLNGGRLRIVKEEGKTVVDMDGHTSIGRSVKQDHVSLYKILKVGDRENIFFKRPGINLKGYEIVVHGVTDTGSISVGDVPSETLRKGVNFIDEGGVLHGQVIGNSQTRGYEIGYFDKLGDLDKGSIQGVNAYSSRNLFHFRKELTGNKQLSNPGGSGKILAELQKENTEALIFMEGTNSLYLRLQEFKGKRYSSGKEARDDWEKTIVETITEISSRVKEAGRTDEDYKREIKVYFASIPLKSLSKHPKEAQRRAALYNNKILPSLITKGVIDDDVRLENIPWGTGKTRCGQLHAAKTRGHKEKRTYPAMHKLFLEKFRSSETAIRFVDSKKPI